MTTAAEIREIRRQLARLNLENELRRLERRSSTLWLWSVVLGAWLVILSAYLLTSLHVWLLPLTLLLAASRQRALGNALHEASHTAKTSARKAYHWLVAVPMFEDFDRYQELHRRHHAYLGTKDDPDLIQLSENAYRSGLRLYLTYFTCWSFWRESAFARLPAMNGRQRLAVAAWWGTMLLLLGCALGAQHALGFLAFWMISRATSYHAIKVFTELSDHAGLEPGSIFSFTRNCPANAFSFFLHPHSDNYHLTHHLVPHVSFRQIAAVHRLFLSLKKYAQANHCTSYFFGATSVTTDWWRSYTLVSRKSVFA
jgi:fatty acid desaturase